MIMTATAQQDRPDVLAGADPAASASPFSPVAADAPALVRALDAALGKLETAVGLAEAAEAVHDARKALKEYRALLRLIETPKARTARRGAAEVARGLSAARDRTAAREALDVLREDKAISEGDFKAAKVLIGKDDPAAGEVEARRGALRSFAAAARADLCGALGEEARHADILAGLAKAYRRARRGAFESSEAIHELRKAVVTHRYQMTFVADHMGDAGAKPGARRAEKAQTLRDLLGTYHDLDILLPVLDEIEDGLGLRATRRVDAAARRHQKALKKLAVRQHARLFRRPVKAFARKLGQLGQSEVAPEDPEG